ncbi:hypothetical protein ACQ4PT_032546 [Festuca glaucescens]
MDSRGKHRRVHDRLSDLPDSLLHGILSGLGSRQAVQTSALSRRWRQLWRDVPCADIDEREFAAADDETWERFEDFADHMLTSIPRETQLDAFRLHLVRCNAGSDRWIRRGLQHVPASVDIRAAHNYAVAWQPHVRISPGSSSCAAGFTRRLTRLRLVGVSMVGFLEHLHEYCPALEDLHVERCKMYTDTDVVASPMLRRLAIVDPSFYAGNAALLRITAPGLAFIRLEMSYKERGYHGNVTYSEPMALLTEASIRHMEKDHEQLNQRNIQSTEDLLHQALLEEESQEFPVLHNLKTLILEECDIGQNFEALSSIIWNTIKLEKLGLHHCMVT